MGSGSAFLRLLRDVRRAGREPPPATEQRQRNRLARLVAFARERSEQYRDRYAGLPREIPDLRILPPVSKGDLVSDFERFSTDPAITRSSAEEFVSDPSRLGSLYRGRYLAFSTSGTSGRPAVFLHDREGVSVYLALFLVRLLPALAGAASVRPFLRNRARTATVVATGGHYTSSVLEAIVRSRLPRLSGANRTFSLMDPLPELVRRLTEFGPAILGSYATALSVLAAEQVAGRLALSPALLLSGAERLSPRAAAQIGSAFGCPVRDTYAASEFPGIAFDCRSGRLHANADWVILEPVDPEFRPVPPGVASHTTLLTNLANRVLPLIRYDLGDSVTFLPDPCPCGSPLPSLRAEGRRDEILRLLAPDGRERPLLPLVLGSVVEEVPGAGGYQVVQTGPGSLRLRLEEAPGFDRETVCGEIVRRLREYLRSQGLHSVEVEISRERPVRNPSGGKLIQFFREIDSSNQ